LCGGFFNALGLILMKYSMEMKTKTQGTKGSTSSRRMAKGWWYIGFLSTIMGSVGIVLSVGYGNLILLASSCPVNMIFNLVLSVYILKETFTKWDALAIAVISAGSVSCMILSK
jgi:drug/metabolite transporter (DMT)-like permease